ncbi:hypothetical protein MLD38_022312 [Melastoma candidum]|uniref:Uncharacterized protein n=1 Tax=Melastoma candidum TaxID=119954 RepID=A0ACB9QIR1_9MYRT|nr:hypothetical protein MLD38_022312 [Melastoma candidum]
MELLSPPSPSSPSPFSAAAIGARSSSPSNLTSPAASSPPPPPPSTASPSPPPHSCCSIRPGGEREGSGPVPNNASGNASAVHHKLNSFLLCARQVEKAKVQKEDHECDVGEDQEEEEEGHLPLDPARSSFSLALKECKERRSRYETQSGISDRRRPASVEFNNGSASSPRMGAVKMGSLDPGNLVVSPVSSNTGMKSGGGAAYVPFNHNGRALPI